jgi:hypothetical protein
MVSEIVCCVLYVPVDIVKERLQVQSTSIEYNTSNTSSLKTIRYKGSLDALRKIAREEGFRGIYRGYAATLISYGTFSALYFLFYEEVG